MAKKIGMTVDEVKKRKIDLEKQIFDLIKAFETETKVRVSYIDMIRKRSETSDYDEPCCVPTKSTARPLQTVNLNVDLDLLF